MYESVGYSEPGPAQGLENLEARSGLAPANPVARLFARVVNGAILFLLSCGFWLGTLIVLGAIVVGDEVRYLWPILSELTVGDAPDAGNVIEDALSDYGETYSFGAATLDAAFIVLIPLGAALLVFVLLLMYLTLMVRFAGGDFGHLAMGLRVVNYGDGRRPSFGQALGRALLKQLDGLILPWLVNGVMVLVVSERRHLYDLAANTMVMSSNRTTVPFFENGTAAVSATPQLTGDRAIPLPPSRT